MLVRVSKRLEQVSCCRRWKNSNQLSVLAEAPLGEELMCEREPNNQRDYYAVAVQRTGTRGAVGGYHSVLIYQKKRQECVHWFCEEEVQFAVQFVVLNVVALKILVVNKYSCV